MYLNPLARATRDPATGEWAFRDEDLDLEDRATAHPTARDPDTEIRTESEAIRASFRAGARVSTSDLDYRNEISVRDLISSLAPSPSSLLHLVHTPLGRETCCADFCCLLWLTAHATTLLCWQVPLLEDQGEEPTRPPSPLASGYESPRKLAAQMETAMRESAAGISFGGGERGVGIDVEPVKTFENASKNFIDRNFTEFEKSYCFSSPNPAASLAGRWAAKEAVIKAISRSVS